MTTDVFAHSNPAFCSTLLHSFVFGYANTGPERAPFILMYVVLPIAASSRQSKFFKGTRKDTGLTRWIHRHPEATLGLDRQISTLLPITKAAIEVAFLAQTLKVDRGAVALGNNGAQSFEKRYPSSVTVGRALRRASRFGAWCGQVDSAATVLGALGVSS